MAIQINAASFECPDDVVEAFKGTKEALKKGFRKPRETKVRAANFLIACLDTGIVKDPGNRVRKFAEKILE